MTSSSSSSQSCKYDVFLSFRGEDTRKTFVDHLYSALKHHLINIYKDDEALPRGESICPSLFKAIEESRIAVIIFSKNYADSSWCLDELAYIMKCKDERAQIVMPIFYGVDPSEVRYQKRKFGEAFAKQKAKNITKAELWRKALVDASNIAGWEPTHVANGNESKVIKEIVDAILDRLCTLSSNVDEDLVGMTTRLLDLKSRLDIGSVGVRMLGIWGVGGGGKTTLATSIYMEISQHFQGHCILENIREETSKHGLNKLQENMLSTLFKKEVKVYSVAEGKRVMKSMLCRRKVLVILDDVNTLGQLEALAGKHNWFGSGSRIIITTRDEHLLRTHKVDHVYPIRLLSNDEAIQLLKRHAYNEEDPVEDYETLSLRVISYASGLPLALRVIGSFLYDKSKNEWISALDKLKDIPDLEIIDILKISFDGLEAYQKELFLDIACFWSLRRNLNVAMEIFEACGYHPEIGIKVLRQKALINIVHNDLVGNMLDMHDLVEEMGLYIVRGKNPNNPRKHSRVWIREEIEEMCFGDATMENEQIEALTYSVTSSNGDDLSSRLCKVLSNMKRLRWLKVSMFFDREPTFLSNELQYINWEGYLASPFPDSFQPLKLVVLKLRCTKQKELWKGCKHLPNLKVLQLEEMKKLLSTPDFYGFPRLQKLTLERCYELEEIHLSFGTHTSLEYLDISGCPKLRMFPTISHMRNLRTLKIKDCNLKDEEIPSGIGELSNLENLDLSRNDFSLLDFSISQLTNLKVLKLFSCRKLIELPELPSSLVILKASYCKSLTTVGDFHRNCKRLCLVSLMGTKIGHGGRLLQSMLEGNAIENGSMLLLLPGLEIPMEFTPSLLRGSRYTLQLPENWHDDFSGFLMCVVSTGFYLSRDILKISVKQVLSGLNPSDGVVWEESDGDEITLAWYVSFGSLRRTTWWDQTYKALSFENADDNCRGFGVRLVDKKISSELTELSTTNSYEYPPDIKIEHDKASDAIMVSSDAYVVY